MPDLTELTNLLEGIKPQICEECIDEDGQAYIEVTIGVSIDGSWDYQTGDNSFSGAAYRHKDWGVTYIYADSDCEELAQNLLMRLQEMVSEPEYPEVRNPDMIQIVSPIECEEYPDLDPDLSHLTKARLKAYHRGDFSFIGVMAEIEITVNGVTQHLSSAGLWGIESDSDPSYIETVKKEETLALVEIMKELGIKYVEN
jgi:hypothetical protein